MDDLQMFVDELYNGSPPLGRVTDWRQLSDALVEGASSADPGVCLAYLNAAAWREILPAWMVASLRLAGNEHFAANFVVPAVGTLDLEMSKDTGDSETAW